MKNVSLLSLVFIVANISCVFAAYFICQQTTSVAATPTSNKQFKIAIIQPVSHPALDEIAQGFKEALQKHTAAQYKFTVYNANGNLSLLQAQAEEAAQGNYDLLFTIGSGASKITKAITTKKQIKKPIVFCAVDDPVGIHLVNTLESSGNNVTGVTVAENYQECIPILLQIKPRIKKVLLVYDPSAGSGMEKYKTKLEKIVTQHAMTLESVEVYHAHEIQQKCAARVPQVDVVMTLTDNTVVSGIDSLIKLCNQHGVLLVASDLNSGMKGAALAYGVREYDTGAQGAQKARLILEEHRQPTTIPVTPNNSYTLLINRKTMALQGLQLNPLALLMASIGEVV